MASKQESPNKIQDDSVVLMKLEYAAVCVGLAYTSVQLITTSNGHWSPGALFTGVCIPLLCWLYSLEASVAAQTKQFIYKSYLRSSGSLGLWCCVLLPVCLFLSCHNASGYKCSESYAVVSRASIGMLVYSVLWIQFAISQCSNTLPTYVCRMLVSIAVFSGFLLYKFDDFAFTLFPTAVSEDVCSLLILICLTVVVCEIVMHQLLVKAPNSFTLGEAIIISQGCAVFLLSSLLNMRNRGFISSAVELNYMQINDFVNTSIMGCAVVVIWLTTHKCFRTTTSFYLIAVVVGAGFIFPGLYFFLGQNPFTWMWIFVSVKFHRLLLLGFWGLSAAVVVLIAMLQTGSATTIVRKYFHIILVAIFIPGIVCEPLLLYLAVSLVFGVFVLLECVRVLNVAPLGHAIRVGFSTFLNEKDAGLLVLAHIYLLVGCALPLWLMPFFKLEDSPAPLVAFAGLLSIGVGDTMASIGGTLFGRHCWPGAKKTVQGTFLAVIAQLLFCYAMNYIGCVPAPIWKYACPVVISSLLESFTTQVDNLTLPLFMYAMFI